MTSISKLNSQFDYKIDLSSIHPFTPQTEKVLIGNIFFPLLADTTGKQLQGVCRTWQSLAQELDELLKLEKQKQKTTLTGVGLSTLARKCERKCDRLNTAAFEVRELLYILDPHQEALQQKLN